ncbi:2'-5' RNA ligase family protein [Sphingomonas panacisoli]|uniref:2'-5' RNA ligase family protein n=1 Tax=Sphingomonas panacisoli TaxID=1813879 RepID=A0A5B8LHF1_9SPHN|nr:2'-5' RNA ligase family protein [Sphingomonas panacisoli]QDZ07727.1 2'-5' RNA ligase family protein [Sphingomonas panacisoli]
MSDPAPIIVTALFGREDQGWFDRQRRAHFPPERNFLQAHLTMFHHLPPSLAGEVREQLAVAAREGRPAARIAGLVSLGRGVAYRIDSAELAEVRASLADRWAPLLTPQDASAWRPHVTIQNKVEPAVAKASLAELQADFRPRTVEIAGYAAWWYRGGPWQPLSRYMCA